MYNKKEKGEVYAMMAPAMADSRDDWSVRGIKYPAVHCNELQTKQLLELITSSSTAAMNSLGLDITATAANNPLTWNEIPSFQQAATVVKSIRVVNNAAERSVALMTTFNHSITRRESEMKKLIQVVGDN